MAWLPGQSGNRSGRPKGARDRKNLVAAEFAKEGSAIARVVMDKALEGDMSAASLVLQRLSPPLRAAAEKVTFEFDPSKPLFEQAQQVLIAVSKGSIDPDTGQMLVNLISSFAGIRQVDDLAARIEALEQHRN